MKNFTLDAKGKKLGRIATEIAMILRGKNSPDFAPHKLSDHTVTIENASQLDISDSKMKDTYKTFSGYPGGLRHETRQHLLERRGIREIFLRTVHGMLPNNKLRSEMLKRIIIKD